MFLKFGPSGPVKGANTLSRSQPFSYAIALLLVGGCSTASIDDYRDRSPAFVPEDFFSGALTAHGVVKDFSGTAIRHFNADIIGCWSDGVGTLDESFLFDDGEQQTRVWTLTPSGNQAYIGTAGDVVGDGTARWEGNAMFLDYTLRIALEDSTCLLYTSPSPRDRQKSRMPSSA